MAGLALNLNCKAAILINADTGAILYEKESDKKYFPASTTKIATAIYALSLSPNLDQEVVGNQECLGTGKEADRIKRGYTLPSWRLEKKASHIGIKVGEILTLRDLFKGMIISSGCDASNLIAETVSGSIPLFLKEMNAYLKKIGCKNTNYLNPHGLYHPEHLTTAYDLAQMTKVGLKNPFFLSIFSAKDFMRPKTNKQEATKYPSTNRLVRGKTKNYPFSIGGKTGYTSECGYCLVAAAEKGGRRLISVILGAPTSDIRFEETIALFEAAFNEKQVKKEVVKAGVQPDALKHPSGKKAVLKTASPITYEVFPAEEQEIRLTFEWLPDNLGKYTLTDSDGVIQGEALAVVDEWIEERTTYSYAWLSLLGLPLGYIFLRR